MPGVDLYPESGSVIAAAPAGAIMAFASASLPAGWLFCDGGVYNRADYPLLFTALGGASSPFGLPSGTTFQVPDLNGRTVIGEDAITYFFADQLGEETHALSIAELPGHDHDAGTYKAQQSIVGGANNISGRASSSSNQSTVTTTINIGGFSGITGGSLAHNNMQPSLVLHYGICTGQITTIPSPDSMHLVVTSSTRPAAASIGAVIFESDTGRMYMNVSLTATPSWKYMAGGTDPCGARAYRNSAFSLTVHATNFTLIPFDTELWDYGSNFATGTGRYTCAESGQFRVDGRVSMTTSASGERFIGSIFKNASEELRGTDIHSLGAIRVSVQAHGVVSCVAGDILDFRVQQTAGTARGVDVGQSFHSVFEVSRA